MELPASNPADPTGDHETTGQPAPDSQLNDATKPDITRAEFARGHSAGQARAGGARTQRKGGDSHSAPWRVD